MSKSIYSMKEKFRQKNIIQRKMKEKMGNAICVCRTVIGLGKIPTNMRKKDILYRKITK